MRLPSLHRHPWTSVLFLGLLAIAANQVGFALFYGAFFHLGSIPAALALLLLTACDSTSAARVAELLSEAIRSLEIRHGGSTLSVTLSVGVACLKSGRDDPDSLITRAQSALYRAMAEGRGRVVIA